MAPLIFSIAIILITIITQSAIYKIRSSPKIETSKGLHANGILIENLQMENLRLRKMIEDNIKKSMNSGSMLVLPSEVSITHIRGLSNKNDRLEELINDPDCDLSELVREAEKRAEE